MKQATKKKAAAAQTVVEEPSLGEQLGRRLREGAFILLSASALFFLVAFISYHQTDPSWSTTGETGQIANAAGVVGAWLADLLLSVFGGVAYLLPVILAAAAWKVLRQEWFLAPIALHQVALRLLGLTLVFSSLCGLASLHVHLAPHYLPLSAGGMLGDLTGTGAAKLFNAIGATLLLVAVALSSVTFCLGVSWFDFLAGCRRICAWFASYSHTLARRPIERLQTWRAARAENKAQARQQPKIELPEIQAVAPVAPVAPPPVAPKIHSPAAKKKVAVPRKQKHATGTLPGLRLLDPVCSEKQARISKKYLEERSKEVEERLLDFGVTVQVVAVHPGPVVTRFELQLAAGVKVSKISGLAKDLARSLSVTSVRVVEIIPGKSVIGLELPNADREMVQLTEVLASSQYDNARSPLSLALGKDIAGHPVVVDVAKMPHLLVAGTTGSGKSVGLNGMLLSILYKATPEEVRMILIDPKMLELAVYEGIPHLLTPVVTDMKDAGNALRWCVAEMERRYRLMAALGVRNLQGYNQKVKDAIQRGEPIPDPLQPPAQEGCESVMLGPLPFILVLIDEFADMMMVVGKKVEELIARIAQKARAAGIHLVLATQRPSVDVITGLIKANIPTRIAFQVSSRIDSRTIIDQQGAEHLLGHGDMLYLPPGSGVPVRVHGAYVADHEVHQVVDFLKETGAPEYLDEILDGTVQGSPGALPGEESEADAEIDALYDHAVQFVIETRRASISAVQRRLKIGYNRAARMIEAMEHAGLVSPMGSNGAREVLVKAPETS